MREMVDDYTRQLDVRDQSIRRLESQEMVHQNEMSMLVYKENEQLKQENRMLRDKVTLLDQEINLIHAQRVPDSEARAMREEIERLNHMLQEKDV